MGVILSLSYRSRSPGSEGERSLRQSVSGTTWARTHDSFLPAQNSLLYIMLQTDKQATQARSLDELLFYESAIGQLSLCSVAWPPDLMVYPTVPALGTFSLPPIFIPQLEWLIIICHSLCVRHIWCFMWMTSFK